jgi:hypothetical protein
MVIFGLKNHASEDYRDKTELEHKGKLQVAMTPEEPAELDRQAEQEIIDTFGPLIEHQPQTEKEPGE